MTDCISAEDIQYIRILAVDTGAVPIFSDQEITTLLTREKSFKAAAARMLDLIAGSELLLSKKITTQDLSTDGPAVAAELRRMATSLRKEAAEDSGMDAWGVATWSPVLEPLETSSVYGRYNHQW